MPKKAEIEAKYADEEARLREKFAMDLARLKQRKARDLERVEEEVETEEAQAAITTTSVGNAASAGGQANYAPHMGTFTRRGFKKAPSKHKKKERKKARTWQEHYFEEK